MRYQSDEGQKAHDKPCQKPEYFSPDSLFVTFLQKTLIGTF